MTDKRERRCERNALVENPEGCLVRAPGNDLREKVSEAIALDCLTKKLWARKEPLSIFASGGKPSGPPSCKKEPPEKNSHSLLSSSGAVASGASSFFGRCIALLPRVAERR